AHGVTLPEPLVRTLHTRTEGWAAGLRLAALGLQGHEDQARFVAEFAGDDGGVADYLVAEALARQAPRRRAVLRRPALREPSRRRGGFLRRRWLPEGIWGARAGGLTGEPQAADALEALARANGFVLRVDGARGWYRYHTLFGELLRTRARRELADELPELHR